MAKYANGVQQERKALAHDQGLEKIFETLWELMTPPEPPRREIGYHARLENKSPGDKASRIPER